MLLNLMRTLFRGRHLSDAKLFRHLDGEATPDEGFDSKHLSNCARCSRRLEALAAQSERLSAVLEVADQVGRFSPQQPAAAAVRPARWSFLRRAALVAGLLGAGAFLSPVAWAGITRLGELVWTHADEGNADANLEAHVRFAPRGSRLAVEFTEGQAAGGLTVLQTEAPQVALRALNRTGSVEFVVEEWGLRVVNRAGAVSDYELRVPPAVTLITVRIGHLVQQELSTEALGSGKRTIVSLTQERSR